MSEPAIRVENLGKKYRLRHRQPGKRYKSLRDVLATAPQRLWSKLSAIGSSPASSEDFWALKEVSFEIPRGEAVAIIGRNGAGKSTLLKLLSRITEPTTGRIDIEGRIASLLEVGTGFHPELTGRENIYLNGAILGMSRVDIKRRFDEIVAFAEVEKFLDTAVKHYSSGMYTRLAFAVAAHLEPDILIVDEVLAVGDAEFQKKCLGKMQDVSRKGGRTILFVSHNMQAVLQLCERGILLSKGRIEMLSSSSECVRQYISKAAAEGSTVILEGFRVRVGAFGGRIRFKKCEFKTPAGQPASSFDRRDQIVVTVTFQALQSVRRFDFAFAVLTGEGTRVFSEGLSDQFEHTEVSPGPFSVSFTVAAEFFKPEPYYMYLWAFDFEMVEDYTEGVPFPTITDNLGDPTRECKRWGVARLPVVWQKLKQEHHHESPSGG